MRDSDRQSEGLHKSLIWESIQYDYLGNRVNVHTNGRYINLYCPHPSCDKWINIDKYYLDDETPFSWGHVQCPTCNIKYEFDKDYKFKAFEEAIDPNQQDIFDQTWIQDLKKSINL